MNPIIVHARPAIFNVTIGFRFFAYGGRYRAAANSLEIASNTTPLDPVLLHLYCHSLELYLKSFMWLKNDQLSEKGLKDDYGHDVRKRECPNVG